MAADTEADGEDRLEMVVLDLARNRAVSLGSNHPAKPTKSFGQVAPVRSRAVPSGSVLRCRSRGTRRAQNFGRHGEGGVSGRARRRRRGTLRGTMSMPEKHFVPSLEDAVAELRRDPSHPVRARLEGLDVELRALPSNETNAGVGSRLAAIGPWEGIALDDLERILREGREAGGSAPAPELP